MLGDVGLFLIVEALGEESLDGALLRQVEVSLRFLDTLVLVAQ